MCRRNRTRSEEGCRKKAEIPEEVDLTATKANTKKLDENESMVLDMVRTGAVKNRTAAFRSGQVDDKK